jgi:molybdenum cofactor guanylyltransferase
MNRVPVYILAGGKSSRFGSDKARALIDGRPLICRIAQAVAPHAQAIKVVAAQADAYADLGLATIADRTPGAGPLAGLQAALDDANEPWLLLLSCDLVQIEPAWIEKLLAHRRDDVKAVAFRDHHWQPLLALYHRELASEVDRRLVEGQLRMQDLLSSIPAAALPMPEAPPRVWQVNTPQDLATYTKER